MGFVKFLVIACLATLAASQADTSTALPSTTPDVTTPTPTTPKPTTAGPITSTDHSTQPPPTTPAPAPTTSSTERPTSSTQAPTSPEPTTPKPNPKQYRGNYTLKDEKGDLCVVMLTKLTVVQNKTIAFTNGTVDERASKCGDSTIELWIAFTEPEGTMQITFTNHNSSYFISEIAVQTPDFKAERRNLTQFEVGHNKYYKCWKPSEVDLKEENVRAVFAETEYEAFRKSPKAQFVGAEQECSSDYHSDVVIIAIGCALALLVVIILVAYLIARRKNRQRGYQSV